MESTTVAVPEERDRLILHALGLVAAVETLLARRTHLAPGASFFPLVEGESISLTLTCERVRMAAERTKHLASMSPPSTGPRYEAPIEDEPAASEDDAGDGAESPPSPLDQLQQNGREQRSEFVKVGTLLPKVLPGRARSRPSAAADLGGDSHSHGVPSLEIEEPASTTTAGPSSLAALARVEGPGGERGIRTPDTLPGTPDFEAAAASVEKGGEGKDAEHLWRVEVQDSAARAWRLVYEGADLDIATVQFRAEVARVAGRPGAQARLVKVPGGVVAFSRTRKLGVAR